MPQRLPPFLLQTLNVTNHHFILNGSISCHFARSWCQVMKMCFVQAECHRIESWLGDARELGLEGQCLGNTGKGRCCWPPSACGVFSAFDHVVLSLVVLKSLSSSLSLALSSHFYPHKFISGSHNSHSGVKGGCDLLSWIIE